MCLQHLLVCVVRRAARVEARTVMNWGRVALRLRACAHWLGESRVTEPLPNLFAPNHLVEIVGTKDDAQISPRPRIEVGRRRERHGPPPLVAPLHGINKTMSLRIEGQPLLV